MAPSASCVICLEDVARGSPSWWCATCAAPFHLACVQAYVASLLARADAPTAWPCAHCRTLVTSGAPREWRCHCGKERAPQDDPFLPQDSCGAPCGRALAARGAPCEHRCAAPCHAGACPPCPRTREVRCGCGATRVAVRCGEGATRAPPCGGRCGAALSCGHACESRCHDGACPPCVAPAPPRRCRCGAAAPPLEGGVGARCGDAPWLCETVCGALFDCRAHACREVCCARRGAAHGACPRAGASRRCACGAAAFPDLPCDVPTPRCSETCGTTCRCGRSRRVRGAAGGRGGGGDRGGGGGDWGGSGSGSGAADPASLSPKRAPPGGGAAAGDDDAESSGGEADDSEEAGASRCD
jgi:transcriptional repressor NF-X1